MSENVSTTEAAATDATETQPEQPKPTDTVDFWKQKAREQEKRAKDNASAAARLADIEQANKSETEKAAERVAAAEKDAAVARAEALRFRIATKVGISDEDADLFLTGTDEETLIRQAERLRDRAPKDGVGLRVDHGGRTSTTTPSRDDAARDFFGI